MEHLTLPICAVVILCLLVALFRRRKAKSRGTRYDARGFDHNRIHRNGTQYDDLGYDFFGYDKQGFNRQGYNAVGKNAKGQYDRCFDTKSAEEEGFCSPRMFPIILTTHATERMCERLGVTDKRKLFEQATKAYRYGKSKRQIKKSSAYLIEEIENRHDNAVVLIYNNYIYVFSTDNKLITVYKNERIPL